MKFISNNIAVIIFVLISVAFGIFLKHDIDSSQEKKSLAKASEVVGAPNKKPVSIERIGTFNSGSNVCEAVVWLSNEVQHTVLICTSYNGGVSVAQIN